MIRGRTIVLDPVRKLTLLVNCRGKAVDDVITRLVLLGRKHEHATVSMFGDSIVGKIDRRVSDDGPGAAQQVGLRIGIALDQLRRRAPRHLVVSHLVEIVGGRAEHDGGLLVIREGIGELEGARNGRLFHLVNLCAGYDLQVLAMRVDGGVTRLRRLLVLGVLIGGALILDRCVAEIQVLE